MKREEDGGRRNTDLYRESLRSGGLLGFSFSQFADLLFWASHLMLSILYALEYYDVSWPSAYYPESLTSFVSLKPSRSYGL